MIQTEIAIPAQPTRMTLGRARALRDQLEKELSAERPSIAEEVTAIALRFRGADEKYRQYRPNFYRKRKLDQLYEVGCFIAALERKRV